MHDEHEAEDRGDPARQPAGDSRSVLLLDTDLFFVVKVTDTLKHAGFATQVAKSEADFERRLSELRPVVALVNTAARGVDFRQAIRVARAAGVPVVAFGSHVDLATQEEARRAGATRVIANAKVASDLPGVLQRVLGAAAPPDQPQPVEE
jgi:ActR/RegA family two-component response regulator